jgi:acyl carrier protein
MLRASLQARLPGYMVPAAFVSLARLPLTPNGKIDRQALPEPEYGDPSTYVGPRTLVEEILSAIWAEVLGVERVGVTDDFFALGGHSLTAMRIAFRTAQALGIKAVPHAVFDAPTVAQFGAYLAADDQYANVVRDIEELVRRPHDDPVAAG